MRGINRVSGVVLGIVLVLLGLFAVVEAFAVTFWNRSWPLPVQQWRRDLAATPWTDGRVLLGAVLALAVGVLIVIAEAWRHRPARVDIHHDDHDDSWLLRRGIVEREAATAARSVDGVNAVAVRATGDPRRWRLGVVATTVADGVSAGQVREAIHSQLGDLGAANNVPVHVTLRRARSRA